LVYKMVFNKCCLGWNTHREKFVGFQFALINNFFLSKMGQTSQGNVGSNSSNLWRRPAETSVAWICSSKTFSTLMGWD